MTGLCIWLTGLPASGKTTLANELGQHFHWTPRTVTILDGDVVRSVSPGLGFSKEDRHKNVMRVAFLARQRVDRGHIVVVALISPYQQSREAARISVEPDKFVEVYVDTPLEECERRDPKGLYAKARRGEIQNFTGVNDPYEPPTAPDYRTSELGKTPPAWCGILLQRLEARGLI